MMKQHNPLRLARTICGVIEASIDSDNTTANAFFVLFIACSPFLNFIEND
jgi:hypothetical protein